MTPTSHRRCHCTEPASRVVILRSPDGRQAPVPVCERHAEPWRELLAVSGGRYADIFGRTIVRVELAKP